MDQGTYHISLLLLRHFNKVYKFALTVKIWCCENNKSHQNLHAQKPSLILLSVDNTLQLLVYFKSAVKYMARVFATLSLHGRPGHDGCQSACGTVLGNTFSTWWQICPPKQPHNALWQPSWPGLLRNLKVVNTAFTNSNPMSFLDMHMRPRTVLTETLTEV